MENESVSRQEKLTCHCTKWHDLNRDQFRLKWSYKSRTWGSHFVPFFSKRRFEHSIHSRAKAVYIQSIIQPSSETQGQIKGAKESPNGWKNIYGTKISKERREEPLGTMSYQTKFQTVAAVLASDWCQKNTSFLFSFFLLLLSWSPRSFFFSFSFPSLLWFWSRSRT